MKTIFLPLLLMGLFLSGCSLQKIQRNRILSKYNAFNEQKTIAALALMSLNAEQKEKLLDSCIKMKHGKMLVFLVDKGMPPNQIHDGLPLLQHAIRFEDIDACLELIKKGADITKLDATERKDSLMASAEIAKDDLFDCVLANFDLDESYYKSYGYKVFRYLIDYGSKEKLSRFSNKNKVFDFIAGDIHTAELLTHRDAWKKTPELLTSLSKMQLPLDDNFPYIQNAIEMDFFNIVPWFVEHGVDLNKEIDGYTPVEYVHWKTNLLTYNNTKLSSKTRDSYEQLLKLEEYLKSGMK